VLPFRSPFRQRVRAYRRTRPRFSPAIAGLEDRLLLATNVFNNAAGGDWDVAANWTLSGSPNVHHVPTSTEDVVINLSGVSVTHTGSTPASVRSLTVNAGSTLNFTAGTLNLAVAGVTSTNAGTLSLSNTTVDTTTADPATLTNQGTLTLLTDT